MDTTGKAINAASTAVANSIVKSTKGDVEKTVRIKKDEMIKKIDELFLKDATPEELKTIQKLFSPWQKGNSVKSKDERYELKTFLMGIYSKWLNLRSSLVWVYDWNESVCYECKAWSMKSVVKHVKGKK